MEQLPFTEAMRIIVDEDPRYAPEAYLFVRDALNYTTRTLRKPNAGSARHVSGTELLEGLRKYVIREYGAMAKTVLNTWGIHNCRDIGEIVFNLVGKGIFGKTERDSIGDFENGYDFTEVFSAPFRPDPPTRNAPPRGRRRTD